MPFEGVNTRCTSPAALHLALELSELASTMDVSPWLDAGWQDFSFQVDDMLLSDLSTRKSCEQAAQKARGKLDKLDPISQFLGFRRQRETLDACKAWELVQLVHSRNSFLKAASDNQEHEDREQVARNRGNKKQNRECGEIKSDDTEDQRRDRIRLFRRGILENADRANAVDHR